MLVDDGNLLHGGDFDRMQEEDESNNMASSIFDSSNHFTVEEDSVYRIDDGREVNLYLFFHYKLYNDFTDIILLFSPQLQVEEAPLVLKPPEKKNQSNNGFYSSTTVRTVITFVFKQMYSLCFVFVWQQATLLSFSVSPPTVSQSTTRISQSAIDDSKKSSLRLDRRKPLINARGPGQLPDFIIGHSLVR